MSDPAQGPEEGEWDPEQDPAFNPKPPPGGNAPNNGGSSADSGVRVVSPVATSVVPSFVDMDADADCPHARETHEMPALVLLRAVTASEPPPGTRTGETLPPRAPSRPPIAPPSQPPSAPLVTTLSSAADPLVPPRPPLDDDGMGTSGEIPSPSGLPSAASTGSTVPADQPHHEGGNQPPSAAGIPGTPPTAERRDTLDGVGGAPRPRSTRRVFALSLVLLLVSLFIGGVAAAANYAINNWWLINPF